MVIPSSKDPTLAPPGAHVCLMFTQYTPYRLNGKDWTEHDRNAYADNGTCQIIAYIYCKHFYFSSTVNL